jgi:hypothetical protein
MNDPNQIPIRRQPPLNLSLPPFITTGPSTLDQMFDKDTRAMTKPTGANNALSLLCEFTGKDGSKMEAILSKSGRNVK